MNARYYDPELVSFVSADTIVPNLHDPQSLHRYSFAQQDPIDFWDPSGHMRASVERKKELEAESRAAYAGVGGYSQCTGGVGGADLTCGVSIELMGGIWAGGVPIMMNARGETGYRRIGGGWVAVPLPPWSTMQRAANVEVAITHTEVAAETVEPDHPLKDSSTEKRAKWKGVPFLTPEEEAENERLRELVQNMNRDYKVDPYPTLPAIEKRDLIGQGEPRPIKGWPGVMKLTYPDYVRLPTELERIAQSWKDANKHREKAQEILDLGATLITAEPIRPPSVYRTTPHRIGAGPPFQPPTTLRLR